MAGSVKEKDVLPLLENGKDDPQKYISVGEFSNKYTKVDEFRIGVWNMKKLGDGTLTPLTGGGISMTKKEFEGLVSQIPIVQDKIRKFNQDKMMATLKEASPGELTLMMSQIRELIESVDSERTPPIMSPPLPPPIIVGQNPSSPLLKRRLLFPLDSEIDTKKKK